MPSFALPTAASQYGALLCGLLCCLLLRPVSAGEAFSGGYRIEPLTLPGANGVVVLDYFAYDRSTGQLWVPASNTGFVDIINELTDSVFQVGGFNTGEVELRGRKVVLGPTSVSVGDGVVYIGNRGDSTLCVINSHTFRLEECIAVAPRSAGPAAAPDGIVYVAAVRELWVTTGAPPLGIASADKSIQVFDATKPDYLKRKTKIPLEGSAEGYAVDNERGVFYTNLEEKGRTLVIDVRRHKQLAQWNPGAGDLQGLALDQKRRFLFVACGDHVVALDAGHDGRRLDSIDTGAGLDNIDFDPEQKLLYVAASVPGTLTLARVDDEGKFHLKATVPTAKGARGVVAARGGRAYLIDPLGGRILKLVRATN